ncbi:MAG: hypothetical protein IPH83_17760 [Gammaproteobacteria bacterium]|nr:hypothetical protein [Gammaproteobacteria bacterium]
MAIEIRETFQVAAPIEQVWSFMKSPENLAGCMPGASITQLIDERSFIGTVKLRVGAITASYDGTMSFIKLDESAREMTLLAEAREKGGGTVSGTISASLVAQPDGSTEVRCESSTDLTGRIVQVGPRHDRRGFEADNPEVCRQCERHVGDGFRGGTRHG